MPKNVTDDELELFNSYDIVDTDGDFNPESYQKWFKQYVKQASKSERKLPNVTKAIEHANNISLEATKNIKLKNDAKLTNGLFDKKEFIDFIVDLVSVDELKKETKEMIKEIINDDKKDDKANDAKPLKKEEKKDIIKILLEPLLAKCSIENELPKNVKDDINKFLEAEGMNKDEIEEVLNMDSSDTKPLKKEEKPYNPYTDWKFIYYMWTLGHDYSRFLFSTPKPLGETKSWFKLEDVKSDAPKLLKRKKLSSGLEEEYKALNSKYGLKLDVEELEHYISKDNYNQYFEKLVKESYASVKANVNDSVEFIKAIESFCSKVAVKEQVDDYKPYGGMDNNKIGNLLKGLREPDYNFTLRAQIKLHSKFGNLDGADPAKVGEFVENSFRIMYSEAELHPGKYEDLMSEAIALYKAAKDIHAARGLGSRLFGRAAYNKENTSLRNVETLINKELAPEKREIIDKALEDEIIYKKGYKEELGRINNFSLDLAENSYEIIDNVQQEKTTIDLNVVNEKDSIEVTPTPQDEMVKENLE